MDIGKAYNNYIRLLPNPEDWACILDLDTMFLTPDVGHQIENIIKQHPDTGLFTCITNRVGNLNQCLNGVISEDPSLLNLRRIALQVQQEKRNSVKEINEVISGMMMCIQKKTWQEIGEFPEGRAILGVDNLISKKILAHQKKILIMEGVYLIHFYRMDTGKHDKSHLAVRNDSYNQNPVRVARKKVSRFI